jgi:hypothetical protein
MMKEAESGCGGEKRDWPGCARGYAMLYDMTGDNTILRYRGGLLVTQQIELQPNSL